MSAVIRIPTAWRALVPDADLEQLRCEVQTVGEALAWLAKTYPVLAPRLLRDGRLVTWTNVFLDDTNIRDLSGLETPLTGDATLIVLPAMAGG